MAFRDSLEAALARIVALEADLAASRARESESAERAEALRREIDELRTRVRATERGPHDAHAHAHVAGRSAEIEAEARIAYDAVLRLVRADNAIEAFQRFRTLSARCPNHDKVRELHDRLYCRKCCRTPRVPNASDTSDYAKYWSGQCPVCASALVFRPA